MTAVWILWGGPEDGFEVEIPSQQTVYTLMSPHTTAVGIANRMPQMSPRKAQYVYNKDTKRFEWKGYV